VANEIEDLARRLVDLELRYMRAERMLAELSDVIVERGREIDRLTREVKALREQVLAAEEAPRNDRPPHY
jgi:uncharacterized coiled-coil protein SlyX